MNLYSIKDVKSGFMSPVSAINDEIIKRDYFNVLKDERSTFSKNPEDFELWKIAEFDIKTGAIVPCLEFIANCQGA